MEEGCQRQANRKFILNLICTPSWIAAYTLNTDLLFRPSPRITYHCELTRMQPWKFSRSNESYLLRTRNRIQPSKLTFRSTPHDKPFKILGRLFQDVFVMQKIQDFVDNVVRVRLPGFITTQNGGTLFTSKAG